MTRYIKRADGKLAGSIGSGKDKAVPTPAPYRPVPTGDKTEPGTSRNEGYIKGRGKEEAALVMATNFLQATLSLSGSSKVSRIIGEDANYQRGDLELPSGKTIEVKGQPIDPVKFSQNFVEVGEITSKDRHLNWRENLPSLLGVSAERLASVAVDDRRTGIPRTEIQKEFGSPDCFSVSILSISKSKATIYVNTAMGHLYIYTSDELMKHIRNAFSKKGFYRNLGESNTDTVSVLVPLPRYRFVRDDKTRTWVYAGIGDSQVAIANIRRYLS